MEQDPKELYEMAEAALATAKARYLAGKDKLDYDAQTELPGLAGAVGAISARQTQIMKLAKEERLELDLRKGE